MQGDMESFAAIVQHCQTGIYNLALRILNDREEAQDATQEAFIKLYSALPTFRGEAKFTSWFYRIATNVCLDRYHRNKKQRENILPEYHDQLASTASYPNSTDPAEIYQNKEWQLTLQRAIAELPLKYRTVLVLRHLEGFSYQEIADIMQIPVQTVGTQIYRAKAILQKKLKQLQERGHPHG